MSPAIFFRRLTNISLGLLLISVTGCGSDPGSGRQGGRIGRRPPPTPLAGQGPFFNGKLLVELTVGALAVPEGQPEAGKSEQRTKDNGGRSRPGGGGGSFSLGMAGGHGGGREGGRGKGSPRDGEGGERSEVTRPMTGSLGPPVLIRLRFTNKGAEPIELHIMDFSSALGNFAVQPDRLTLAPGQSLETEPMSSMLDEDLAEANATLVLRLADQTEKQVVVLRAVPVAKKDGSAPPPEDARRP